ncbi:MAG: hypothetical protein A3J48_02870 [Candidatus Doudnabacteria bacterium RIFCSPHIGHO2_02_FULL_46_11]|uniref:Putative pre-16S rRNA nuclease n=1 Tax=Candidatus Doudnabacteria bacterium RIFCSPHIGHO2_02_FULL_46_11 TaxID=1817832 RepID=A0A1F5P5F2_9BACT|nr:MAG: hypothetical protein A3J48_02870 [Candidatus Doudnabacteria bacterium RIFCSPHIGHO2_02_FULL_46_11]
MGRILALDVGEQRTGFAITDEEKIISQALPETADQHELLRVINEICNQYDIEKIVVGLPLTMSGEIGSQAQWVKSIGETISTETGKIVDYFDERLTTKQVLRNFEKDKNIPLDSLAAQALLEQYLRKIKTQNAKGKTTS